MTTVKTYKHICDVPDCEREVTDGGSYWDDNHLCVLHRSAVSESTMNELQEATKDCLRESHEGGTRHYPKACVRYSKAWDMALMEIQHPLQKAQVD